MVSVIMASGSCGVASASPEFDACLIENMTAVNRLTEEIERLEPFPQQDDVAVDVSTREQMRSDLLALRGAMLIGEDGNISALISAYSGAADARIDKSIADGEDTLSLAASAIACAEQLP